MVDVTAGSAVVVGAGSGVDVGGDVVLSATGTVVDGDSVIAASVVVDGIAGARVVVAGAPDGSDGSDEHAETTTPATTSHAHMDRRRIMTRQYSQQATVPADLVPEAGVQRVLRQSFKTDKVDPGVRPRPLVFIDQRRMKHGRVIGAESDCDARIDHLA